MVSTKCKANHGRIVVGENSTLIKRNDLQRILAEELRLCGLDYLEMVGSKRASYSEFYSRGVWHRARYIDDHGDTRSTTLPNLRAIRALERIIPGSARALRNEFGIRVFGRYSPDLLREQLARRLSPSQEACSILWALPCTDHNGGCFMPARFKELATSCLKGGIYPWFIEAASRDELCMLARKTSGIAALIISGHSNGDRFDLSEGLSFSSIDASEAADLAVSLGAHVLVLDGCYSARVIRRLSTSRGIWVLGSRGKSVLTMSKILGSEHEARLLFSYSTGAAVASPEGVVRRGRTIGLNLSR